MTNSKSDRRLRYLTTTGSTAPSPSPTTRRSARRQTVRATCSHAPAVPATGKDEPAQRRQLRFQTGRSIALNVRPRLPEHRPWSRAAAILTDGSASLAPTAKSCCWMAARASRQVGFTAGGSRRAQARVQLVHLPVGLYTLVGFRDARPVEKRRLAGVAGLCVDLHAWNYRCGCESPPAVTRRAAPVSNQSPGLVPAQRTGPAVA